MMKRLTALLLLAAGMAFSAAAQAPKANAFKTVTDSLQQRMKRRSGGVNTVFKLEKVQARGTTLDFHYSQNLAYHPWRQEDVEWFKEQVKALSGKLMDGYEVGEIYAKKQNIKDLPIPLAGSDGKPVQNRYRRSDPRGKTVPLVSGDAQWRLGLSGRHIAIWQSHGRYWDDDAQCWDWQRSPTHRTLEDVYTQSYVLPFLMPMLENAGAVLICPRERDPQPLEVVCDNDESFKGERPLPMRQLGGYLEKGQWEDAGPGFADFKAVYSGYDNPFRSGSARKASVTAEGEPENKAVWRPVIPEKGRYAVYVSYKTLSQSTTDAQYTVHHLGGETLLHVNQKMSGGTWVYLGTYLFNAGNEGYVSLSSRSSGKGFVTADAVRFGGGMGKVERGGRLSGLPAYVEGAMYHMQYSGMDLHMLDNWTGDYTKDYAGRGAWVQEMAGRSWAIPDEPGRGVPVDLSVAFHTDAGVTKDDGIIGTLSIYTRLCENSDQLPDGESRMSCRMLCDFVQTQVVEDLRQGFEPQWQRRGLWDRSYSESRTTGVPALLLELLSHQNFADMRYGLDPSFRFTACRAVYKGILKYLSARYGCAYAVQPLPVHGFQVRLEGSKAVLSWKPTEDPLEPTATAEGYQVYVRKDDADFGAPIPVEEAHFDYSLEAGHVYSFKVTACNGGGESFPSEILAAGMPLRASAPKVVIVNNFTRVSAPAWFDTPLYGGFTDDLDSGVPWGTDLLLSGTVNQFDRRSEWVSNASPGFGGSNTNLAGSVVAGNSFDFVAQHARSILAAGYAFESSSEEAFDGSRSAFAADIICGKQLTTQVGRGAVPDRYPVFPASLQAALRAFTSKSGNVLISGAYIGTDVWDHVYQDVPKAPESTRDFVREVLGYKWATNYGDASGKVDPLPGSGLPAAQYNREWNPSVYRVENPDGLAPAGDETRLLMRYHASPVGAATLYQPAKAGYRVAAFGFPLETSPECDDLIRAALRLFTRE